MSNSSYKSICFRSIGLAILSPYSTKIFETPGSDSRVQRYRFQRGHGKSNVAHMLVADETSSAVLELATLAFIFQIEKHRSMKDLDKPCRKIKFLVSR